MPIKIVVRQIGIPNPALDIISAEDTSEYLSYQYPGYELGNSHYLGEVKDSQGSVQGYKMMFVLTKNEEVKAKKA